MRELESIAHAIAPSGASLECGRCGQQDQATPSEVERFLQAGWPTCCGETMTFQAAAENGEPANDCAPARNHDAEIAIIEKCAAALSPLADDAEALWRVFEYLLRRFHPAAKAPSLKIGA